MENETGQQVADVALGVWTLPTRIDCRLAHYTGQAELAEVIQGGLEARTPDRPRRSG
jgi:hypothetical protein